MKLRRTLGALVALAIGPSIAAEKIVDARYALPVNRYGHFALGRPHEYASLMVTTSSGRKLALQLPESDVFEDLLPRRVRLAAEDSEELLTIVSSRISGARLVLIRLGDNGLAISAESAPIGTPMRWLNPVGVADLDADGYAEIAAVITPHIGGALKVYRRNGDELVEIAALAGFSNHVYGSPELTLSTPMAIGGRMHLLVPDTTRLHLRIVALDGGRLVEIGRCRLSATVTGAIRIISAREVSIKSASREQVIVPGSCLR